MDIMSEESRTFQDKFMLRFPDGMRDRLKAAAADNNRSMNAEIIARLEASFAAAPERFAERFAKIEELVDILNNQLKALDEKRGGK